MKRVLARLVGGVVALAVAVPLATYLWLAMAAPAAPLKSWQTVAHLLRAPFAPRVVIGDSRVAFLPPRPGVLLVGYDGATMRDMEWLTGKLCRLSNAPVTFALGVNDARTRAHDLAGSLAAMERMVHACAPARITLAAAWPVEQGKRIADVDPAVVDQVNRELALLAERRALRLLPAPALAPGATVDGVHFTPETSQRYSDMLSGS